MAAVICPNGLAEAAAVAVTAETTYYSVGVTPTPKAGRFGVVVAVTDGTSAPTQLIVTLTIQTADAAASSSAPNSWRDLESSAVQITSAGSYSILCVDPIFDKVRLKITVSAINNDGVTVLPYWLGDTTLTANS
jgi:hypothetical protein